MKNLQFPTPTATPSSRKGLLVVALLVMGIGGGILVGQRWYPSLAASYFHSQLSTASEDQVEDLLNRIAQLDEAGIPVLVEALASDRESMGNAAYRQLLARLEYWGTLTSEERGERQEILALALAEQVNQWGPVARSDASDLARKILRSLQEGEGTDSRTRVIMACDEVLRADLVVQGERSDRVRPIQNVSQADDESWEVANSSLSGNRENESPSSVAFEEYPGGGVPISPMNVNDRQTKPASETGTKLSAPALLSSVPPSSPIDFSNRSGTPMKVSESMSPPKILQQSVREKGLPLQSQEEQTSTKSESKTALPKEFSETLDLMRQLVEAENDAKEAIETELKRRGFSKREIELARRMFDPDPQVRQQLVQELPGIPGIEVSTWLLQCCHDSDAEVRLGAFSLLSTSSDPVLLRKVQELGRKDTDSRIRSLAEKPFLRK